jgi:hypothetical protein
MACAARPASLRALAARLFGAAGALREAVSAPLPSAARALREPYLGTARSRLGEVEWARAWEEGRAMLPEEAVAYALGDAHD